MNTIVKNYDKQTFIQYANAICEGYKTIKDVYNVVGYVGAKMNGKVFNKRFATAIENTLKERNINAFIGLSDQFNMGYKDLKIYLQDRSFQSESRGCVYFDYHLSYNYVHNADNCEEMMSHCDKEINKWQDAATNYDNYKTAMENAIKEFGKAVKNINSLFVPYEIHSYDWRE